MLNKGVWRADPDGGNEVYFQEPGFGIGPADFAYDTVEDKLYAGGQGGIRRMNRDGSAYQVLFFDFDADQIEVDYHGRKIYWVSGNIQRSNLDGSGVEDFVTGSEVGNFNIGGLTIIYSSEPIPATSVWGVIATGAVIVAVGAGILKKRVIAA
jgi:hypothetical protein